ncbi:diguanylate cyclase [Tissierella carlieri]|uniref:Diguanylate cyclase n=1 Tax=Tissierella carlieri TaxID=689904 RepID=A0ABT1S7Y4_9FIRM|nr:diguanylate cyclase [Tissierella carlieri]MCQ4922455.1 diguanylate cyclase [Tissierella carlieri]
MYKEDLEINGIIQIIMNQEHRIYYSSIDNKRTYNYLKKLKILENLPIDLRVQYAAGDNFIGIDKFYICDELYYIIIINPKSSKCCNCSKTLIDDVTGLYSRSYWEQINSEINCHLSFKDLSLILIDIDNLKKINDSYGHLEGDKAIKVVGQAIQKSIRKEDIGIRYGGDEFIVLLLSQDKNTVDKVIKRIRRQIYKQTVKENIDIQISAGVASNNDFYNMEDIIRIADKNLYKEKKMKKSEKREKMDTLKELKEQIEVMRDELNKQVIEKDKVMSNEEILELSQKLEKLIVKYLKDA